MISSSLRQMALKSTAAHDVDPYSYCSFEHVTHRSLRTNGRPVPLGFHVDFHGDEPNDPYADLAVLAEEATDRAEYLYDLLSDLKAQTFLCPRPACVLGRFSRALVFGKGHPT